MCSYVAVVRGDRASVEQMMLICREWLGRGIPVLIFPEGTRSETGAMQAFKDGAFFLALETGAPIIPIAIRGTAQTLPKHGLALQGRMDAIVEVLDPIDPAAFSSVPDLREHTRARIADALEHKAVVA
jgi:1-acyl-sn-glycerol-3-phosphate acyltransferase